MRLYVDDGNLAMRRARDLLVNLVLVLFTAYVISLGFGLGKSDVAPLQSLLGAVVNVTRTGGFSAIDPKKASALRQTDWNDVSASRDGLQKFVCQAQ